MPSNVKIFPTFWKQWDNLSKQEPLQPHLTAPPLPWGSRTALNTEASWGISCYVPRKKSVSALFLELFFDIPDPSILFFPDTYLRSLE